MRRSLASLAKIHYGKSPNEVAAVDGHIPIVGTGGIYGQANRAMFDEGIVVARKGSLGKPHLFRTPFWPVDTTYAVVPFDGVSIEWLYYCLLDFDLTKLNEATGVPSINRNWLAKIGFENPGRLQQRKISTILSTIDTAIEQTEALIEKYQHINAGLMHDLFTRGVLPTGQLRPPREQAPELYQETAMGWIPREWTLIPLQGVADVLDAQPDHRTPQESINGIPYVGIGDFNAYQELVLTSCRKVIREAYAKQRQRFDIDEGDVIYGKIGTIGQPKMLPFGGYAVSANVILFKPKIDKLYFYYAISDKAFEKQISNITNTTSQPALGIEKVRCVYFPMPHPTEATDIGARIHRVSANVSTERQHLDKLKLLKLGLMQDLLTGKVSVTTSPAQGVATP